MSNALKRVTVYDIGKSYVEVTGEFPTVVQFVGYENLDKIHRIPGPLDRVMSRVEVKTEPVEVVCWTEHDGTQREEFFVMTPSLRAKLDAPFRAREDALHDRLTQVSTRIAFHATRQDELTKLIDAFQYAPIWKRLWMAIKGEL